MQILEVPLKVEFSEVEAEASFDEGTETILS
jgi:hypothetical protein